MHTELIVICVDTHKFVYVISAFQLLQLSFDTRDCIMLMSVIVSYLLFCKCNKMCHLLTEISLHRVVLDAKHNEVRKKMEAY